jgi:hypothetical protein
MLAFLKTFAVGFQINPDGFVFGRQAQPVEHKGALQPE